MAVSLAWTRPLAVFGVVASLAGLILLHTDASARPGSRPMAQGSTAHWYRVANPARGRLKAVDMVSSDVAWAVSMESNDLPGEVLAFRDGKWQVAHSQADRVLMAVDMVSPKQGWAVGFDLAPLRSVLLPIDAGVVGPAVGSACDALIDVSMLSPTDGWAVGTQGSGESTTCILQLKAGKWTRVPSPGAGLLSAVTMMDAENGWAIGSKGLTLRYDDSAWREVTSPVPAEAPGVYLAMALTDMGSGWAVGDVRGNTLKLTNGRWSLQDIGLDVSLGGVDMLTGDLGFAAGRSSSPDAPVILRFQDGVWRPEDLSHVADLTGLIDVDMIAPDDGWAVGGVDTLRYGVEPVPTTTPTPTATPTPVPEPVYLPDARRP